MQKRSDYIAHNSITLGKPLHLLAIPGILEETNIFSGNTEFLKHLQMLLTRSTKGFAFAQHLPKYFEILKTQSSNLNSLTNMFFS